VVGPLVMAHILRCYNGGRSRVKLAGLPFWLDRCNRCNYIYIFEYVWFHYFGNGFIHWSVSIFGDPPNFFFFRIFNHRLSLGIFPLPRGNHLLDHVSHCTVILTRHYMDATSAATSMPRHCTDFHVAQSYWSTK
jgi:hypothetical protein